MLSPTEEHSVQDQFSDEDRTERFRSVQDIYDDTQEIGEDEACFLTGEEPMSFKSAMKEKGMEKSNGRGDRGY